MVFLCADTHGLKDIDKVVRFFEYKCRYNELTKDDYLIILGDSGICWDDSIQDKLILPSVVHGLWIRTTEWREYPGGQKSSLARKNLRKQEEIWKR